MNDCGSFFPRETAVCKTSGNPALSHPPHCFRLTLPGTSRPVPLTPPREGRLPPSAGTPRSRGMGGRGSRAGRAPGPRRGTVAHPRPTAAAAGAERLRPPPRVLPAPRRAPTVRRIRAQAPARPSPRFRGKRSETESSRTATAGTRRPLRPPPSLPPRCSRRPPAATPHHASTAPGMPVGSRCAALPLGGAWPGPA